MKITGKNTLKSIVSLLLAVLLLLGTVTVAFAAPAVGKVTGLSVATRTDTQIKIKWKSVAKASGYLVELFDDEDGEWNVESYTSDTYYVDKSLTPGVKYTYRVKAYVKSGSARTFGSASDKLAALTDPARVTKVKVASSTPTSVKLTWSAAKGATGYLILQSKKENGKYEQVGSTKKTSYKLTFDVAPGTLYFKVKSTASVGDLTRNADASPAVDAPLLPAAVSEVSVADSTAASVKLNWSACKGATGYLVYQKDISTNKEYVRAAKTSDTSAEIVFPAAPGTVRFKVQSFSTLNGATAKGKFSPVLKLSMKPEKVTSLSLKEVTPTSLTLLWNKADGASSYEVYQRDETTFTYQLLDTTTDTTYTVKNLDQNTTYHFSVKSVADYKGNVVRTGYSPILSASTVFGSVTGVDFILDSDNKLFLTWQEVPGADGYEVERSADGQTGWTQIADIKGTVFEASKLEKDGVLSQGGKYYYRVRAHVIENGETLYSAYTAVLEVHPKADAPTITRTGTASQDAICIEWTAMDGADGYEVFFYDDAQGAWRSLINEKSMVGSSLFGSYVNEDGVKTAYYLDHGLTKTGDYKYRVRSVVKNSNGYNYSEYSAPVTHHYEYTEEPRKYYSDAVQKTGVLGYLYDPAEKCFFTADDPWQRYFGFNQVYDIFSQPMMIQYDTHPVKFTCHNGEKWMIQPWKGQYGWVLYGGEVGIYRHYDEKDEDVYDCAKNDDMMKMEMDIKQYNAATQQWEQMLHRPYGHYWWITGFKFGYLRFVNPLQAQSFTNYTDLRLDLRITFMDFDMRNAFVKKVNELIAEQKTKYGYERFTLREYGKNDLDIYLIYR